jgi:hypothetical protein
MTKIYKIIRAIVVALLIFLVVLPVSTYILLSTGWAQDSLRKVAQTELSNLLGTQVTIGHVDIAPFNRLSISDVTVADDYGKTALKVNTIASRFELLHFIRTHRIVIDYAAIDGLSANLYKKDDNSPLNIAKIIENLKPKEEKKEPAKFDLAISTVKITNSSAQFNILSHPANNDRFDAAHISISNIDLVAYLPKISDTDIIVELERLRFDEKSGFALRNLTAQVNYSPTALSVHDLDLQLQGTHLAFAPIEIAYANPGDIAKVIKTQPMSVELKQSSFVTPSDLAPFLPVLSNLNSRYDVALIASGTTKKLTLTELNIVESGSNPRFFIEAKGNAYNLDKPKDISVEDFSLKMMTSGNDVASIASQFAADKVAKVQPLLAALGKIKLDADVSGSLNDANGVVDLSTAAGSISANATMHRNGGNMQLGGSIDAADVDLYALTGNADLGMLSATIDLDGEMLNKILSGTVVADFGNITYKDINYNDLHIDAEANPDKTFAGHVALDHQLGTLDAAFDGSYDDARPSLALSAAVQNLDLESMGIIKKYDGYKLSAQIDADLAGKIAEWVDGYIDVRNITFEHEEKPDFICRQLRIDANSVERPHTLSVKSDFLNGKIEGNLSLLNVASQAKDIVSQIIPAFISKSERHIAQTTPTRNHNNNFNFEFEIANAENFSRFFNFPVQIIYPVTIDGFMDYDRQSMLVTVDAPYLQQGDKIIENTAVQAEVSGDDQNASVYFTTTTPTQKGTMAVVTRMTAAQNRIDTTIDWFIEREKQINGVISFSTLLGRDENGGFTADVNFNPGDINFGDAVWRIAPSEINWSPNHLAVHNFNMSTDTQSISINGVASNDNSSEMKVDLNNIHLQSIFETLDIDKALICGDATGQFHAKGLFGKEPYINCDNLHVKNIGYNYCVLGDGDIKAHFDNTKQSFYLDADIVAETGEHSHIYGDIFATKEALDINFDAKHVKVGFLKPFMSAFAEDVKGYASGKARLFGTFKNIDLEGDLFADDLGLKIAFTNTWYYATDSVHIKPGRIDIKDITLKDAYGNTALLNGYLKHDYFHNPVFDFRITNARNFLSYDVTSKQSPDWYGRIFGNGSASVTGAPGVVNIDVNMATADGSTFTFVLSDAQEADDYKFITFRDAGVKAITDSIIEVDRLPAAVREYRDRMLAKAAAQDAPSAYNMNFQVDITPAAKIILVMDPVGGDEIKAYGSGNLRMTYASQGNDLHMYGTYTIDRGSYNFTLQDIIVKDFTIKEGSSIAFTGDPYSARLDIQAIYSVNANLSDLDESFLQDKELNRTNVPVHALLMASGDMRQPDISFDLEFPTLTSDVYRKVRSIVSTEDMMNRQIIYLLALNRFYTPDYMSSTTKGNELFSVASSTLGAQLSSMLGKLSENWSIAPNLRSDRGDFSDIEVDVALSSSLLNNRLRFNGNFGYRDKSLNTNQFIGDFDIEYLLNRTGTWRLKAYNRYNDQNYYLRTAQTTQGVGIMFKRDFDNIFGFLRRRKSSATVVIDTINTVLPSDTIQHATN